MIFTIRQDTVIRTGRTRSHSVENSLWRRLLTCCKADCGASEVLYRFRKGVDTQKFAVYDVLQARLAVPVRYPEKCKIQTSGLRRIILTEGFRGLPQFLHAKLQ